MFMEVQICYNNDNTTEKRLNSRTNFHCIHTTMAAIYKIYHMQAFLIDVNKILTWVIYIVYHFPMSAEIIHFR